MRLVSWRTQLPVTNRRPPAPTPPLTHAPPAPAPAPQEAKQFLHEKDGAPQKGAAAARDPRANAKPKVDLFS